MHPAEKRKWPYYLADNFNPQGIIISPGFHQRPGVSYHSLDAYA